jgi:EAL domain-containing protein (putative c-di-GMP-specific phosphodiesterase class I)/GGDEF domain-containing protein
LTVDLQTMLERRPLLRHFLLQSALFLVVLALEVAFDLAEEVHKALHRFEIVEIDMLMLYLPAGLTLAIAAFVQGRRAVAVEAEKYDAMRRIDPATDLGSRYALDQRVLSMGKQDRLAHVLIAVRITNYLDLPRGDLQLVERALFARLERQIGAALQIEDSMYRIANDTFALLVDTRKRENWRVTFEETIAEINEPRAEADVTHMSAQLDYAVSDIGAEDRDAYRAISHTDAVFDDLWYCQHTGDIPSKYYDQGSRARRAIRNEVARIFQEQYAEHVVVTQFQPVYDLQQSRVVGAEALVRLRSPNFDLLTAQQFLVVAARIGLARRIDWIAANAVVNALAHWPAHFEVSMNVSRESLRSNDHMRVICAKLSEAGVEAKRIGIEIPAAASHADSERMRASIQTIRDAGFRVILDSLGDSSGSIARLGGTPASAVKLGRSLLAGLAQGESQRDVVSSVIEMSHRLGMRVIAQRVETWEQLAWLKAMGCDGVQGFLVAPALTVDEFPQHLAADITARMMGNTSDA